MYVYEIKSDDALNYYYIIKTDERGQEASLVNGEQREMLIHNSYGFLVRINMN